jgi:hypothetical protein
MEFGFGLDMAVSKMKKRKIRIQIESQLKINKLTSGDSCAAQPSHAKQTQQSRAKICATGVVGLKIQHVAIAVSLFAAFVRLVLRHFEFA